MQINRRMEFVFASHSFDVWESWSLEGSLDECSLVNCRNSSVSLSVTGTMHDVLGKWIIRQIGVIMLKTMLQAVLEVRVEILAMVGDDGITRWTNWKDEKTESLLAFDIHRIFVSVSCCLVWNVYCS